MSKKRKKKGGKTRKVGRSGGKKGRSSSKGGKRSSGSGSGSSGGGGGGGGTMMSLRGGFKGAVGTVTGKKPKTRWGSIVSNVIWTLLTIAAVALLAYKIYKAV